MTVADMGAQTLMTGLVANAGGLVANAGGISWDTLCKWGPCHGTDATQLQPLGPTLTHGLSGVSVRRL